MTGIDRTLPPAGSVTAAELLALPEGSAVVTYGVTWCKIGPDLWKCPFSLHVPRRDIGQKRVLPWQDECDSEWLAHVATMVVFNPSEYGP